MALFGRSFGGSAARSSVGSFQIVGGPNHRSQYQPIRDNDDTDPNGDDEKGEEEDKYNQHPWRRSEQQQQKQQHPHRPKPGSLADFFFGFMYEEDFDDHVSMLVAAEDHQDSWSMPRPSWKHPLHLALALHLFLLSASCAMAVNISMAAALADNNNTTEETSTTSSAAAILFWSTQMTSAAVMGTALGKLLLGPMPDLIGARRTAVWTSLGMAVTWLWGMAGAKSMTVMVWGQLLLEFLNAVQWPCTVVVLAGHHPDGQGIFLTSLAGRLGSLVGMILSRRFLFLHNNNNNPSSVGYWRLLACVAAWSALVAASVMYLYVQDTPDQRNAPSHPVDDAPPPQHQFGFPHEYDNSKRKQQPWTAIVGQNLRWTVWVVQSHVGPAIGRLLTSGPSFWILALAHTGSLVVRTSERILPAYALATHRQPPQSTSTFSSTNHDSTTTTTTPPPPLAVYSSIGTVLGLLIVGHVFANQAENPRARKWLVGRLYAVAVVACYALAFLAIPIVVESVPPDLLSLGQVVAVAVAGAAVAVPCYHIPSLVATQQQQQRSNQPHDRGLFLAYTDGIAYGLASLVWKFLSGRMTGSSPTGWAYGWAFVALLLLVAGVAMTEFMEHYFCANTRRYRGGTYETILLA